MQVRAVKHEHLQAHGSQRQHGAATVSYDSTTNSATAHSAGSAPVRHGLSSDLPAKAPGSRRKSASPPASASFTIEASPPPLLVVTSSANPFAAYLTEILRNEGLDEFTTLDASLLSSTVLSNFDVVLLGDIALTSSQVTTLTNWVNGGGKLIAMHPDKQLAGLLGLTAPSAPP